MKQLFDTVTWPLDEVSVRRHGARRGTIRRQGYAFVPIRRRGRRKKFSRLGLDKRQARAARKRLKLTRYFPLVSFPLFEARPLQWPVSTLMMRYGLSLSKKPSANGLVVRHAS